MLTKTKAVLAAALILGTASAALAGDQQDGDTGGFVLPGSMDGVNPVYHPDLFAPTVNSRNAGKAYGFVPAKQTHRPSKEKTQDR
jgi:hypothetical protein